MDSKFAQPIQTSGSPPGGRVMGSVDAMNVKNNGILICLLLLYKYLAITKYQLILFMNFFPVAYYVSN